MKPSKRRIVISVAACACVLHAYACTGDGTHVYTGQLFVEARSCLGTPSSMDVVSGDDPGTCNAVCILQHRADGGRAVYVSAMCPPYPTVEFEVGAQDPACTQALDAFSRKALCVNDAGTSPAR